VEEGGDNLGNGVADYAEVFTLQVVEAKKKQGEHRTGDR